MSSVLRDLSHSSLKAPSPDTLNHKLTYPDWSLASWQGPLVRVPAVLITLTVLLLLDQTIAAVVGASAALSVGLVGERHIANSRVGAMLTTVIVMVFSAWVGTLAGNSIWLGPLAVVTWSLLFAVLTIYHEDVGWIAMQGVITLVISMAFPSHGFAALQRSAAIALGGLIQLGIIATICYFPFEAKHIKDQAGAKMNVALWSGTCQPLQLFYVGAEYATIVTLTMLASVELARFLPVQNSYWLPMTTIIILKPDFYRTYYGAIQRIAGTFLGVVLASLIVHIFHPNTMWLILLVGFFVYGCFTFIKVNPILFAMMLTAYVVFLIGITGLPEASIMWHRLIHTALGSALALSSRLVGFENFLRLLRKD